MHPAFRLPLQALGRFAVAHGHRLWRSGGVVWCSRCSKYSVKLTRDLCRPCTGATAKSQRWIRANLAAGRPPRGRVSDPAVRPRRLLVAEWLEFRHGVASEAQLLQWVGADGLSGVTAEGQL